MQVTAQKNSCTNIRQTGFKLKIVLRDKDHYILIEKSIHHEDTTLINL